MSETLHFTPDEIAKLVQNREQNKIDTLNKLKLKVLQPKLVYGYVRVSTRQQVEEGHSIEAQTKKIQDYCKIHNLSEPIIMPDVGFSGKSTENRNSFNKMLSLVKKDDTIISYSLSRLGRSTIDIMILEKKLRDNGIRLICLDKNIDTGDSQGRLFFGVLAVVNEFEREQAADRTSMVMQQLSQEGKLKTHGRFGYRAENNKLIPVPEEQIVIKHIILLISENPDITNAQITRDIQSLVDCGELIMRAAKNPNGHHDGKTVHQSTIAKIIKDNNIRDIVKNNLNIIPKS